ncbi:MAG: hypothetical protein IJU45_04440 [Clostridia bacterium]|nr:hypothetical protein [Clostridia bacterium]
MKHMAVITKKPELSGKNSIPDGAITGNGDLAVILGNSPFGARIYISKIDLWYGVEGERTGGLRPLGFIDIAVNKELYENYYVEQDMDNAEIRCRFKKGARECAFSVYVNKGENSIIISQTGNMDILPELKVFEGDTDGRKGTFEKDGVSGVFRSFDDKKCSYETHCFASIKKITKGLYYMFAATNHDVDDPMGEVVKKINAADKNRIDFLKFEHKKEWSAFWSKSSFELSDKELETGWYASQYFLNVCTGNKKFPPGLYANFITVERPNWQSDYHLNYNYQAPFYHACSSNHVEFTDCYASPLEEFKPKGESFANRMGCKGVIYPVAVAPKGICTELEWNNIHWFERLFLGQKNNQIHPADILVFRWKATKDIDFAREHAYPYIKSCLEFFEDYGEWENGRFSVCRDSAHEVPIYRDDFTPEKYKKYLNDKNNTVTLGMLRLCLGAAIEMAHVLDVDADKRGQWQNILDNLSPFPTYRRFGKKVYRYTEKGQSWNETGDVGLQHVYPGGCVGLSSPESELRIARNTFKQKIKCFDDDNAVSSYFPMAARLGFSPEIITRKLHELNKKRRLPNHLYLYGGGCLEYCTVMAVTLNEMALQSHQGVIRIFPDWDKKIDCKFHNLRADGAHLVSSSIAGGTIGKTTIISEKGGTLSVIMPYSGFSFVYNNKKQYVEGSSFTLEVKPEDTVVIE